jgi:hypothetical protein
VTGGDIYYIDTESRRALHYADAFKFRHMEFVAPFSPLDYLAAIEHCVSKGAKTVVIDSMSHEHEGPGGVLEMHEEIMGTNQQKNFLAWAKPKGERRRLINSILQLNANFIFCFRAKEKLKVVSGKPPIPRGWQPIGGEEFVYEMTLNCLLLPASNGVPTWNPETDNEGMIKLPAQFREIFKDGPQLSEEIGEKMARWAAGGVHPESSKSQSWKLYCAANPGLTGEKRAAAFREYIVGMFTDRTPEALSDEEWDEVFGRMQAKK